MAPERVHFAPRARRARSNLAGKTRLEHAMEKIRELSFIIQSLYKRSKKLKTALKGIQARAEAALGADVEDGAAAVLQVQALPDQVQSDLD